MIKLTHLSETIILSGGSHILIKLKTYILWEDDNLPSNPYHKKTAASSIRNRKKRRVLLKNKKSISVSRILISVFFLLCHFHAIQLSLWDRTEIMERFDGTAVSLRIVITLASTNHVTVSIFVPFLSTNQVEPTITFAIELAAAFIQNIVDVNGCRSGGCHFSTEITIHFLVLGIAVSPATGTGTKHVHQVTGRLAGLCGSSFYGSFGSNQIKFGELGDVIRTGTSRIGLSCSGAVVCTIRAEFPKTGIYIHSDLPHPVPIPSRHDRATYLLPDCF